MLLGLYEIITVQNTWVILHRMPKICQQSMKLKAYNKNTAVFKPLHSTLIMLQTNANKT